MKRRHPKERPLTGSVAMPGDKSVTHRALILSALGVGRSTISNANTGLDVRATATMLHHLGATVAFGDSRVTVEGCGIGGMREPAQVLDAGNSGTSLRTMLGVCAAIPGLTVLTGDASLRKRPMLRAVAPLRQMGAQIDGRDHGDKAPLAVRGGALEGLDHDLTVASAQVKTALLLAGLHATGRTSVTEPRLSRDHTERMLLDAGIPLERDGLRVEIEGGHRPRPADRDIPGDISSAMFLIVAALIVPGSDLSVAGVGLNPTRTAALDVLREMGADLQIEVTEERAREPVGVVRARSSELSGVPIGGERVPALIDELPILAIAATQAEGRTEIRGASELRIKESDRVAALAEGLNSIGGRVEPLSDGLIVEGRSALRGGEVRSFDDHRIAMSFAVAGLVAAGRVRVRGWRAVETSFPEFLDLLGEAQSR